MSFLEESKFKEHRLANANLGKCYSKFHMDKLLAMLKEKHEIAKAAGILATDLYNGIHLVTVRKVENKKMQAR